MPGRFLNHPHDSRRDIYGSCAEETGDTPKAFQATAKAETPLRTERKNRRRCERDGQMGW